MGIREAVYLVKNSSQYNKNQIYPSLSNFLYCHGLSEERRPHKKPLTTTPPVTSSLKGRVLSE